MIKKIGSWKVLSIDTVYENNWIRVEHHEVKTPNNTDGIYGLVRFKENAVGIIPIDNDGNTWLVKQSRYAIDEVTWEIPEGGSPLGHNILESAKRELEEETGLKAKEWKELMQLHPSNSVTDQRATIFVATNIFEGTQQLEVTEDIEIKKLPLTEAINMVKKGEITDAMSVAGLLRLHLDIYSEK
ncbi:MAG: NUDIX hydrolase [Cellvibrionaceae bacterium]